MTWLPAPEPRCTDCGRDLEPWEAPDGTCIDCLAPMVGEELNARALPDHG
jgi:predicted amidophosphoribosyltransferase